MRNDFQSEEVINVSCEALAKREANLRGLAYGG